MAYSERQDAQVRVIGTNTSVSKIYGVTIYKIVRENEYDVGKFATVKFFDADDNIIMISQLQIVNSIPIYRVETYYNPNGTIQKSIRYVREFDEEGNLIEERIDNETV